MRTVIVGAAGRDFHDFIHLYRDDSGFEVVAFTATQIPGISGRRFPASLAGPRYPEGIPIEEQARLGTICRQQHIDRVHFAYSDVSHEDVMHTASIALASGADFYLCAPRRTMVKAAIPVIATSAVRTGCGKSQVTRWLVGRVQAHGLRAVVVRHPMPYGDLPRQAVQRFATLSDLRAANCTVEEREEYEPHIAMNTVVYAGVDYMKIVERASMEADILLWDGGNNDFPFVQPDLHLVLVDPLRAGSEQAYHPGEAVLRSADVVVIVKVDSAADIDIASVTDAARRLNPTAIISRGRSPVSLQDAEQVRGKRVLVVDDGPTLTHGGMSYGAGYVAAVQAGAGDIIDPRSFATNEIAALYAQYPHIGKVLPAVGYFPAQLEALSQTIAASDADLVVSGTPCDLAALIKTDRPWLRARYEFTDVAHSGLREALDRFLGRHAPH